MSGAVKLLLAASMALSGLWVGGAGAYELGPGDRVRVNVSEWSAPAGAAVTRVDGEFSVSPAGELSLPLVGRLVAQGLEPGQLSQLITERMQAMGGLVNPPVTSLEVVEYRPFYVLGGVERPGAYPYRPGMLAVHALAIAGGLYRQPDPGLLRIGLDAITTRGEARIHRAAADELMMRRARLQAELDDRQTLVVPPELTEQKNAAVSVLMQQEDSLLDARNEAFRKELEARQQLRTLAEQEARSLDEQVTAQQRRIAIVRQELDELRSLVERRLAPAPRQFTVESALADAEFRQRELQTQLLQAQQRVVKEDQAIAELGAQRRAAILAEIQQVNRTLDEAKARVAAADTLVSETAGVLDAHGGSAAEAAPSFLVIRTEGGQVREIPVSETTALRPGDVLKVVLTRAGAGSTAAREGR